MAVIAAYRRVLGNPLLSRLLVGEFVSSIGDWLYMVALLVLVYAEANDPLALGVIGAARILPYVLLSLPAGIAADRFDRRKILLVTDIARGLIMLLLAAAVIVDAPIAVIIALAIAGTCFAAFFSPAIGAFLPSLVRDESELGPANTAWSSLDNLAFFVGPAFAALLLGIGALEVAFLLNALTFAFVAVVLWQLPSARPGGSEVDASGTPAGAPAHRSAESTEPADRGSLGALARPLSALILINAAGGFVFGGLSILTVVLAVDVYGAGEAGTGLLNSAVGVGGVVGAVVAGVLVLRRRLGLHLAAGAALFGAAVAGLGLVDAFSLALVAMAVAAAGALLVEIVGTTLLQRIVPDAKRGRALGIIETVSVLAYAVGSFALPVLGAPDPTVVLIASGVAMAAAGVVTALLLGTHALQEPSIEQEKRLLAETSMFAGLPPARLEAAMRQSELISLSPGTVVIRQGDAADRFYVIVEGEVEVSQQRGDDVEPVRLRTMGRGEFFGEIGLLSGVPRTATVTALTGVRLMALERGPFLELASAGPGLTYRLLDLHRGASTISG
ncbi:MAG TPA: MFS transporter [Candidatus Limnocylindrales bacterium]|nr:MFS transporter [Candidatus Limnocylindrales bacterium]